MFFPNSLEQNFIKYIFTRKAYSIFMLMHDLTVHTKLDRYFILLYKVFLLLQFQALGSFFNKIFFHFNLDDQNLAIHSR